KCLIIQIQRNWHLLIDEKELEIMEKYTQQGKKFTFICLGMKFKFACLLIYKYSVLVIIFFLCLFFSLLSVLSCATIIILLIWTGFLFFYDIVVPLNGTHRLQSPFVAEYFIDEEVYFYPILLHMYTIFFVGFVVVIATETFYTICMQHACGLFHIVG
ncbi:uncharacterized protein LOC122517218, partial [Polistes fuscatus]|uniref:uncharacterized protein LOC122517218 n=1 Tax=Polistes fuscatus TaxID=30207 RepID=UPI001CA91F65